MSDTEQTEKAKPARKPVAKTADLTPIKERKIRTVRNFPASDFEEPLEFAKQVLEFGAGQPVRRVSLFNHIGKSSESGGSRQLITNSNKYGLIKADIKQNNLSLPPTVKKPLMSKSNPGNAQGHVSN